MRRFLLAAVLLGFVPFVTPVRHEIDGLSMAPALRPGDIVSSGWLPHIGRLGAPRRFDRWMLTAPDGTSIIKRVVGLPGETVGIVGGDLTIDDTPLLTPPPILAEVASVAGSCDSHHGRWQRSFSRERVYDDADFAPEESRRLLPVRDIGLAAVIRATEQPCLTAAIRVGSRAVRWRLPSGRFALVAGLLDGHLVAAAWRLDASAKTAGRSPLPPHAPDTWQIAERWTESKPRDNSPPLLALSLAIGTDPLDPPATDRCLETCVAWRDILHRAPPDGTASWRVGPNEVFLLGDFPSGSRDSRHWGPLPIRTLLHRAGT